jgi:sugar lactone lactonase YvrE
MIVDPERLDWTDDGRAPVHRYATPGRPSTSVRRDGPSPVDAPPSRSRAGPGWPDGMTIDSDGFLWVCLWDGWAIERYSRTAGWTGASSSRRPR